jgi:hypothetical protein
MTPTTRCEVVIGRTTLPWPATDHPGWNDYRDWCGRHPHALESAAHLCELLYHGLSLADPSFTRIDFMDLLERITPAELAAAKVIQYEDTPPGS